MLKRRASARVHVRELWGISYCVDKAPSVDGRKGSICSASMSGDAGGKTGDAWSRTGAGLTVSNTLGFFSKEPSVACESAEKRGAGPPSGAWETVERRCLRSRASRAVVPSHSKLHHVSCTLGLYAWVVRSGYVHLDADERCASDQRAEVDLERRVPLCDVGRADLVRHLVHGALRAPFFCETGSESKVDDPEDVHPGVEAHRYPFVVVLANNRLRGNHPCRYEKTAGALGTV